MWLSDETMSSESFWQRRSSQTVIFLLMFMLICIWNNCIHIFISLWAVVKGMVVARTNLIFKFIKIYFGSYKSCASCWCIAEYCTDKQKTNEQAKPEDPIRKKVIGHCSLSSNVKHHSNLTHIYFSFTFLWTAVHKKVRLKYIWGFCIWM